MTAKMSVKAADQSRYQSSGVMVVSYRFGAQKTLVTPNDKMTARD
jgi:hypothetical protein